MRQLAPVLLFLFTTACHGEHANANAFSWSRDLSAGGTLRIRNLNGTVTVVPSTNGRFVKVQAATHWRRGNPERDLKFVALAEGNDAIVCAHWATGTCSATQYTNVRRRGFLGWFSARTDARVDFTVEVPVGTRVDVSSVNGALSVTAQSPVVAHTVNGGIRVATAIGPVEATTVNGSVDVRMTTIGGGGDVRAESTNGSVSAYVPQNVDGKVSMRTVNGDLETWFPLTVEGTSKRRLEGVLGAGSRNVVVRTVNGSATLGALDALGRIVNRAVP
jgi:hypothetical protein